MSWDLEIDIDFDDFSDATRLVAAMLKSGQPFLGRLDYEEHGPGLDCRTPLLIEHQLDPKSDGSFFRERIERMRDMNGFLVLTLRVAIEAPKPLFNPVYVYIFGSAHTGMSEYRGRSQMVIDFCNRQRWAGRENLVTGEPADERFLVRWLTAICEQARPRSLHVVNEESVSIPFNYHLVYHSHLQGHADDLRQIARLALAGGRGYEDARRTYQPLLDIPGESMLFCRRAGMRLDDLKSELRAKRALLQQLVDGRDVPDEIIEIAALETKRIEPLDTKGGLGIVGEPFLRDYCEYFYLHMLHRLAAEPAWTPTHRNSLADSVRAAASLYERDDQVKAVTLDAAAVAEKLGMDPQGNRAQRPVVDLVLEDQRGWLVPVVVQYTPTTPFARTANAALTRCQDLVNHVPEAIAARIDHFEVLVHRDTVLAPDLKVTEHGELWYLVAGAATPQVWDRVGFGGKPVILSWADLGTNS